MLTAWKDAETVLRVLCRGHGSGQELRAVIRAVTPLAVELFSDVESLNIELEGAEFNGDPNAGASSDYDAYLVCEFRSGDRCYFYAPRQM